MREARPVSTVACALHAARGDPTASGSPLHTPLGVPAFHALTERKDEAKA